MNKKKRIALYFALVLILIAVTAMSVGASDGNSDLETLPEEYGDFLDALPDGVLDKLPPEAPEGDRESLVSAASEMASVTYLLSAIFSAFGGAVTELLPTLALLLGIIILSSIAHTFASNFTGGLGAAVSFACRLCSFCSIAAISVGALSRLSEYFDSLFASVAAFVPLSGVLYAMGGNLTGAASGSVTLSATLAVCQFFFSETVIPVFCACLSLSLLSVFEGIGASASGSVAATVKKWYTTALAFIMMILTAAIAAQGILASKADGAAMRGMKFAASSFIPVSGGVVSSTLGTLAASVELIRGSVGVMGVVIILLMLIPVIVELAAMRGVLALTSFVAGLLGCAGEKRLLDEIGSLYGYLEGIAAISAAVFIIALAVFASTAAAVSG